MGSMTPQRRVRHLLSGALVGALLASCAATRPTGDFTGERVPSRAAVAVPLKPYFRGLRTVEVSIDGAPYSFLVDTAGGRTLVTPRLALRLSCTPRGRDVGYRMNGEPVVFQNCPRLNGSISGFDLRLAPVAVFDLAALLPAELPPLDGVLALDAFRGQIITLDWAKNELVVAGPEGAAVRAGAVPLRFATGENGAALTVLIPVQGALDRMWFLLDSGDIRGTLLGRHAVRDQLVTTAADSTAQIGIGNTARETLAVTVDDINFDGVLGTHYLETHRITLDLRDAP